jgi:hypothetical protein
MLTAIIGIIGGLVAASGWFFAWRTRGESNDAKDAANHEADRARLAEARADAAEARTQDAIAGKATAQMQLRALEVTAASLKMSYQKSLADKAELYEQLAKLGAPVGDVLLDSTTDRLYKDRDRRAPSGSEGAGSGPHPNDLPALPAGPASKTRTN